MSQAYESPYSKYLQHKHHSAVADNDEKLFIDSIKHAIINGTIDCSNLLPFLNDFKETPILATLKTDIADAIQASYKVCKETDN